MNGTGNGECVDNKGEIKVIIRTVATLAFIGVVAVCVLAWIGKQIPPELNTITSGLVASLTAMLVKTSPTPSTPPPSNPGTVTVPEQKLETT